jgi:hypothetical protein
MRGPLMSQIGRASRTKYAIVPLRQRATDRPGLGIGARGTGIKAAVVDVAYTRVSPRAAL